MQTYAKQGSSTSIVDERDMSDLLRLYRSDILHIQRTTDVEERQLVARMANQETHATRLAQEATCRMVEANLRLVYAIARRYARVYPGLDILDLIQEGNIALIHAVKKYNPARGKFSTYAVRWVVKAMLEALAQQIHLIAIPEHKRVEIKRLQRTQRTLEQQQHHEPSLAELAAMLDLDQQQVKALTSVLQNEYEKAQSLDAPLKDGEADTHTLSDILEDDHSLEKNVFDQTLQERIRTLLATVLTPVEQRVIQLRYGLTDEEPQGSKRVARQLGISHQAVWQAEQRAMRKLAPFCQDLHDYL